MITARVDVMNVMNMMMNVMNLMNLTIHFVTLKCCLPHPLQSTDHSHGENLCRVPSAKWKRTKTSVIINYRVH